MLGWIPGQSYSVFLHDVGLHPDETIKHNYKEKTISRQPKQENASVL